MTVASLGLGHVLATQSQHTSVQMYGLHTLTHSLPHTYTQTPAHTARTSLTPRRSASCSEEG